MKLSRIINHIKNNLKTKKGRKILILEVVSLAIGVAVLLVVLPKSVIIPTYIVLLFIVYIMTSMYMIVMNTTKKESKE